MFPSCASLRISCARVTGRTPQYLCFVAILLASVLPTAAQNKISTVAGGGFNSSLNADLPAPAAVTEDASGNLYVAAPPSQYVYEWNKTSGAVTVFAGVGYLSYHHITQKATISPLGRPPAWPLIPMETSTSQMPEIIRSARLIPAGTCLQ